MVTPSANAAHGRITIGGSLPYATSWQTVALFPRPSRAAWRPFWQRQFQRAPYL